MKACILITTLFFSSTSWSNENESVVDFLSEKGFTLQQTIEILEPSTRGKGLCQRSLVGQEACLHAINTMLFTLPEKQLLVPTEYTVTPPLKLVDLPQFKAEKGLPYQLVTIDDLASEQSPVELQRIAHRAWTENREMDLTTSFMEVLKHLKSQTAKISSQSKRRQLPIRGMNAILESLYGPHSSFGRQESDQEVDSRLAKKSRGIGIYFGFRRDHEASFILETLPKSGAEESGLKRGDVFIEVNGVNVEKENPGKIAQLIKTSKENTELVVERTRGENVQQLSFSVPLKIQDYSPAFSKILAAQIGEKETGYLRISTFNHTKVCKFVEKALDDLSEQGVQKLVLDLRSNPGGSVEQTTCIADLFLPSGKKIIDAVPTFDGKDSMNFETAAEEVASFFTEDKAKFQKPMIVLVNSSSTSATEILAGALSSNNRALLLGTPSFGKGTVIWPFHPVGFIPHLRQHGLDQFSFLFAPKISMTIVSHIYYFTDGTCNQATGIQPHFLVKDPNGPPEFREKDLFVKTLFAAKPHRHPMVPTQLNNCFQNILISPRSDDVQLETAQNLFSCF